MYCIRWDRSQFIWIYPPLGTSAHVCEAGEMPLVLPIPDYALIGVTTPRLL